MSTDSFSSGPSWQYDYTVAPGPAAAPPMVTPVLRVRCHGPESHEYCRDLQLSDSLTALM